MKYDVKRQHFGDRLYIEGDEREADPRDVAHLLQNGVLAEKAAPKPKNKAARVPRNKSAK